MEDNQLPIIPPELKKRILPERDMSVLDFLQFQLPAAAQAFDGSIDPSEKILSDLAPSIISITDIQAIPTPPLTMLNMLIGTKDLSWSRLILCLHAPGHHAEQLPTWVISYWIQVFHLRPLKKTWVDAEESLQKQGSHRQHTEDTKSLIKKVYDELACISWASDISGFPAAITTDHLATYLTKNWLSDEHENQMLHLLRREVLSKRREDRISISDTSFMKKLIDVHQMVDRTEHYATARNYAWIQEKGQELATSILDMFITITNVRENHWVALVIDFKSSRILYGDSMGGTIDEDIKNALTWWIHHHTSRHFTSSYLPITRQRDGHSCGILAWIALATFLFPKTYSLMDAGAVADERLRMFFGLQNAIVRR